MLTIKKTGGAYSMAKMKLGETKTFKTKTGRKVKIHRNKTTGKTRILSNTKA